MCPDADEIKRPPSLEACPIVVRLQIQWRDLDAYGYVNNVVYLKWFEAARAAYAERVGVELLARDRGVGAIVASLNWNYHRQLTYPGEVIAGVTVKRISVGSATLECHIADGQTGVPVADGSCDVVLYDYALDRPVPVPDRIRKAVEELEGQSFPA